MINEVKTPPGWTELPSPYTGTRAVFNHAGLIVIVSQEPAGWHLSISHADRYPTWDELRDARYLFLPDGITMAQILPPAAEYVNVHPNCFHLYELEPAGKRQEVGNG